MNSSSTPITATIIPRFPKILHGADYNPEQWLHAPEVLAEDRRLRRLAGCNVFSIGIFSWSALEPTEGVFTFEWLDRVMDDLAEDGCRAMLATPSAARPPWLARKYPGVMRVNRQRQRELFTSRHNFCWSSPIYREKVREINQRLATRYRNHPALGLWHISNELGGSEGSGECFCDLCLQRWYQWLAQRYGTLDQLNEQWWSAFWSHRYTAWEEVNPSDPTLEAGALDWSRFVNSQMREWIEFEAAILREITPGVPVTTNFMGLHPWIDYAELSQAVDVVCDDQYPGLHQSKENLPDAFLSLAFKHDVQRNYKPGRPFFLMESCPETPQWQRPQHLKAEYLHRAEMLQAIAHGAEGTSYFQWRKGRGGLERLHGAVIDHEGSEHTRTFGIVQRLSQTYQRLTPVLGSRRQGRVALLFDHDTRRAFDIGQAIPGGGFAYLQGAQDHYRPFWQRGLTVDVLDSRSLWDHHRLVIAPRLYMLHRGVADRICRFVESGGIFVMTSFSAHVDESFRTFTGGWPGDGLRAFFGLWDEEVEWLPDEVSLPIEGEGQTIGFARRCLSVVHPEGADVLARFTSGPYIPCGGPALLRRKVGQGAAYYLGTELLPPSLGSFYESLLNEAALPVPFPGGLPDDVIFSERGEENSRFWFVANLGSQEVRLPRPAADSIHCLQSDQPVVGDLLLPPRSDAFYQLRLSKSSD